MERNKISKVTYHQERELDLIYKIIMVQYDRYFGLFITLQIQIDKRG